MFVRQYILFVAVLFIGTALGQSVSAGFIADGPDEISVAESVHLLGVSSVGTASNQSEQDVPAGHLQLPLHKNLLGLSTGNGTSAGGSNVSGHGPSVAPAVLLDVAALEKTRLCSYLLEEPELRVSPPFSDGIFRPPIG